jgi:hypothetical protein
MSEVGENWVTGAKKRPIVPRVERARKSLSWFLQAALCEHWDELPEWKIFQKAGLNLLRAINDKGGK